MRGQNLRTAALRLTAVLAKELRSRMWGWRSAATITVYLGLLGLLGLGFVWQMQQMSVYGGGYQVATLGLQVFGLLAVFQLLLVIFIVPGLTAGAIAGERERQTLDLLLVTPLSAFSIVLGKLLSSLAYVLVLLLASLPVFSLAFLFGGVSPTMVAKAFLISFSTAVLIGALGLLVSTLIRRVQMATVATYGLAFFLTFGLGIAAVILSISSAVFRNGPPETHWLVYMNPLAAMASAVAQPGFGIPFVSLVFGYPGYGPGPGQGLPLWRFHLAIVAGVSLALVLLTTVLLRPPRRLRRRAG
ncbi:MAG: ABC transporter permease subunit [Chloroflexi bacterium]|nr:ABC transporter permease subunit [Chloroflexota bacterium]